ncbi:hypothetical protein KEM55_003730 [Ascosphaera atra]|nr:hypothetical protein KEM55_003730 [Ascosphaera atra]
MSLKGFTKGFVRAPQQFKAKFNLGENTKDPVYADAERRFQELEKDTKKLHDESKKYFEAIDGMLKHQIEFSKAMTELYKPISGRASDPNGTVPEGNPEGIQACEEYEDIVQELLKKLSPELEQIETHIINPAEQLLEIIKVIRRLQVKREHKKLDYDRHRNALKKLQDKKDKSLKDEKAMYKIENELEVSTHEYNHYNDLMKEELPRLFELEAEFIKPLFQSFYYMQLNVFYTLHEAMQGMNIPYFDMATDVEEGFDAKRGDVKERAEELAIVHFKTRSGAAATASFPSISSRNSELGARHSSVRSMSVGSSDRSSAGAVHPPSYHAATYGHSPSSSLYSDNAVSKGKLPPPPKPKPSRFSAPAETAIALYDYTAQAATDIGFTAGSIIEILLRTDNTNEWWTGRINGQTGQFPGAYLLSRSLRNVKLLTLV